MVSNFNILLFLFFIFLSLNSCLAWESSSTVQNEVKEDYEKWLSWNVCNHRVYRRNLLFASKSKAKKDTTKVNVDSKLKNAEMNKMILSVNGNGNGSAGDYKTITEALNSVPLHNTRRVIIVIQPGIYREKIHIPKIKPFITFVGDSENPPTITGNDTASSLSGPDRIPLTTFQSATVAIDADFFIAVNIIFENTATHTTGISGEQAVALRISGTKAAFYKCSFYGSQDTLYDHKGLHYFNSCFIQGSVDFIFGYGRSLYENCTLNSIAKKVASLTAQKRSSTSMWSGFSFKECWVTGTGQVYLGRAWGEYSRVVFSYTFMDKLVLPQGWTNWAFPSRNLSVYYGEYKCMGPGADVTGRVPWARALTDREAQPFLGTDFVYGDSWLPILTPSKPYFGFYGL